MLKFLALAICFAFSSAGAQPWSDEQKTLGAMYMTAHVIDWGQTRRIARESRNWVEVNPLLGGPHPSMGRVNTYFTLTPLIGYAVLTALPSEQRATALKFVTTLELATVARNHYIGIRVSF